MGIGDAAEALEVSITTLKGDCLRSTWRAVPGAMTWRRCGRGYGGRYRDQPQDDLERQKQGLEQCCDKQGWTFQAIADLGSGINDHKKSLRKRLDDVIDGQVGRLMLTQKDRLLRFGAERVRSICGGGFADPSVSTNGAANGWRC